MTAMTCLDCDVPGGGSCSVCHGRGTVPAAEVAFSNPPTDEVLCPECGGSGECQSCGGVGQTEVLREG